MELGTGQVRRGIRHAARKKSVPEAVGRAARGCYGDTNTSQQGFASASRHRDGVRVARSDNERYVIGGRPFRRIVDGRNRTVGDAVRIARSGYRRTRRCRRRRAGDRGLPPLGRETKTCGQLRRPRSGIRGRSRLTDVPRQCSLDGPDRRGHFVVASRQSSQIQFSAFCASRRQVEIVQAKAPGGKSTSGPLRLVSCRTADPSV